MNFNRGKVKDFYLLTTDVENLFINEYLPGAPGEYVKVYLYGLLYAQLGSDMTHREMETQLGLSEKTLEDILYMYLSWREELYLMINI